MRMAGWSSGRSATRSSGTPRSLLRCSSTCRTFSCWLTPSHRPRMSRPNKDVSSANFSSFSARVTAKGVEDTAFYIFNRLTSLNEVGGDPEQFGTSPDAAHAYLGDRQAKWPHALSRRCLRTIRSEAKTCGRASTSFPNYRETSG